ncbi:T9SS type A sorting domain-containing protein, partial [Flavihumibacter sediminis]|nr:T9SS type A sorting domain-containing protein [Flavihumibacter sediminis]
NRLNNVKEFRVYPNPVAGSANATINMNEAALATINLHDASGRLLSSRKLQLQKGNNQFSLGELLDYNPGTYIVRVVTATETQQIRVVKAK